MTVLVFGCSVAHGADTVAPGNCIENIPFSYPALVSKHLDVDCKNFAFCGNSNENIFHSALQQLRNTTSITALIVGWTSDVREVWNCEGRVWQFIPSWCASTKDLYKPFDFFKSLNKDADRYRICTDQLDYVDRLKELYQLLIRYKFDQEVFAEKTQDYIVAMRSYCQVKNIQLIETCWARSLDDLAIDISKTGNWIKENRHPNASEHQQIANNIIQHYKL